MATAQVRRKYRLLRGQHSDRQGAPETVDLNGKTITRPSLRKFQADRRNNKYPEFESTTDLTSPAYNAPGFTPRFELVGHPQQVVPIDPLLRRPGESATAHLARIKALIEEANSKVAATVKSFDTMTLEELVQFASDEEIDLGTAKQVDAVRKIVKAVMGGGK